jgi:Lon protease-like protein
MPCYRQNASIKSGGRLKQRMKTVYPASAVRPALRIPSFVDLTTTQVDFSEPIGLFALPQVLVLPHATVPLHMFEPRYRALVRDAVAGPGLFASATYAKTRGRMHDGDESPLRACVCVGRIVQHQQLPDGRYHLLLQGLCRARIDRELPLHDEGYRRAMLEPLGQAEPSEIQLDDGRERLEAMLEDPALDDLAGVRQVRQWVKATTPTATLVDLLALALCRDGEQRYAMLCQSDADARTRWLLNFLSGTRRSLQIAQSWPLPTSDRGLPLN